jgi:hypothetical protein
MAFKTIRSGASQMTESQFLQFLTDLLAKSGVFDITGTQLKVTASGTDMNAQIAAGRAYFLATGGNGYPTINDATITQAVNSNAAGNPRITSIVAYIDLSATPNSDASNVAKIAAVDGTPAASPSAPSGSTIQAAIGASNPYIVLANITVASGATSISNGVITDVRTQVAFRSDIINQDAWVPVTASATTTLDLSKGKKFAITLGQNTTLALQNVPLNCKTIAVRLAQDGTGSRTVTWWSGLSWAGGTAPTLTTTASKSDEFVINFLSVTNDSTNTSEGFVVGQNI